jgi:hypothetical protein
MSCYELWVGDWFLGAAVASPCRYFVAAKNRDIRLPVLFLGPVRCTVVLLSAGAVVDLETGRRGMS